LSIATFETTLGIETGVSIILVTINVPSRPRISAYSVKVDINVLLDVLKIASLVDFADCETDDAQTVAGDLFNAIGYPGRPMATEHVKVSG